jgi:hypothetical protein
MISDMPIVYPTHILYPTQALRGQAYQSEYINADSFDRLLNLGFSSDAIHFWEEDWAWDQDSPRPVWEGEFKYISIDGAAGVFNNGSQTMYVPRSVNFSDDELQALIVEINGQLELRQLPAKMISQPTNSLEQDSALSNPDDIRRLERAVATVLYMPHDDLGRPDLPGRQISADSVKEFLGLIGLDDDEEATELADQVIACAADPLAYWRNNYLSDEVGSGPSAEAYKSIVFQALLDDDDLNLVDWKTPSEDVASLVRDMISDELAELIPPYRTYDDYGEGEEFEDDEVLTVLRECNAIVAQGDLEIMMWDMDGDGYAFFVIYHNDLTRILQLKDELDLPVKKISSMK